MIFLRCRCLKNKTAIVPPLEQVLYIEIKNLLPNGLQFFQRGTLRHVVIFGTTLLVVDVYPPVALVWSKRNPFQLR